jgi:hypothetical protein
MRGGDSLKAPRSHEGANGRREPRVTVDLRATLGGRLRREVRVVDLSLVGCLIRTDAVLDRGTVVDIRIELADGVLPAKTRVAESSLDGASLSDGGALFLAGLEFLGLAARDEQRLRAYVEATARRRRGESTSAP